MNTQALGKAAEMGAIKTEVLAMVAANNIKRMN